MTLFSRVLEPDAPRVSVRMIDDAGAHRDVVGQILGEPDPLVLLPHDGPPVTIRRSQLVAVRKVAPKPLRPSSSADDLARLAADGWRGITRCRLGGWLLQAGGGWTKRANSAEATGDPGVSLSEAVELVSEWFASRGQPALIHLARRGQPRQMAALDQLLADRGWPVVGATVFQTADLRELPTVKGRFVTAPTPLQAREIPGFTSQNEMVLKSRAAHTAIDPGQLSAQWTPEPDQSWWQLFRSGGERANPIAREILTNRPGHYLMLRMAGRPVGSARVAQTLDWIGIAAVEVCPELRGHGLGSQLMAHCVAKGRELGARFGYLQVELDNPRAADLYRRLGWQDNHTGWYRSQP